MNKRDLIQTVAEETGIPKKTAGDALDHIVTEIGNALASGDKVRLAGLGTLRVKGQKARMARNPKTGEPVQVPAQKAVRFSPDAGLKRQINA